VEIEIGPRKLRIFVSFLTLATVAVSLNLFWFRPGGWSEGLSLSCPISIAAGAIVSVILGWLFLRLAFPQRPPLTKSAGRPPIGLDEYRLAGLGSLPSDADGRDLYLDLMKRTVTNIVYQDLPSLFFDGEGPVRLAGGFSLPRRVMGEDQPADAHTMVGLRRLENLQHCIEQALSSNVPGDLIETGAFRGGASMFMRAVLKAHGVTERKVFVCDTFLEAVAPRPHWILMPLLQALASVPSRRWRRKLFMMGQWLVGSAKAFPDSAEPSEDWVEFVVASVRHPSMIPKCGGTGLNEVKSAFARYGLLDEQVVFLQGFFADTLPDAPIDRLAVIRLDGDTYESTRDGISLLYPKLSEGGFCVVDDYGAFSECRRAIDEYRQAHKIEDEIIAIDKMGVYWRKS
jgi:hypothetical protein